MSYVDPLSVTDTTVRTEIAKVILDKSDGIFAGIVKKTEIQNKTLSAENMGNILFQKSLFDNMLPNIRDIKNPIVIYDRGRLNHAQTSKFNKTMSEVHTASSDEINIQVAFHSVDSVKIPGIWASDFIAGAFHCALKHNDPTYRNLLESKFIGNGSIQMS